MALNETLPRRQRDYIRRQRNYYYWLDSFHREMDDIFHEFFRDFDPEPFGSWRTSDGDFVPRVDISENDEEVKIIAELPGIEQKDVDVILSDSSLTIRGEKKKEAEDREKNHFRMEREYGSFLREIPLSEDIDHDKVEANFDKGILSIRLPKFADGRSGRKKIRVESGQ